MVIILARNTDLDPQHFYEILPLLHLQKKNSACHSHLDPLACTH